MQNGIELNLILFCFILILNLSNYLPFYFCNVIRLSKRSLVFLFIYYYATSNINIYVKINFHLLLLSRCNICVKHALTRVFFIIHLLRPVNVIANLTSQYGLKQITNQPTHILNNLSSCIDLLFTSQANLVMESGVHSSDNLCKI